MNRTALAILSAMLLLTGPSPAQPEKKPQASRADEIARSIAEEVARFRGLEWKRPVNVAFYGIDELKRALIEQLDKEMPPEKRLPYERALKLLGLLPKDFDLREGIMALLVEQVAGFYDPDRRELRLIERSSTDPDRIDAKTREKLKLSQGEEDKMVMAHELVHALQDQHFDLAALPLDLSDDDDYITALRSVVEGDAMVGMMGSANKGSDPEALFENSAWLGFVMATASSVGGMGMPQFSNAPRFLRQTLMSPYIDGMKLCLKAGANGRGFEGVNDLFRRLPLSTEQVLHPEKILSKTPDWPWVLTLPDVSELMGGGARPTTTNTLGELFVRVLLRDALGSKASKTAAEGWDGDRYVLYERHKGDHGLLWLSTWDDATEANEAQAALIAWLPTLREGTTVSVDWCPLLRHREDETVDGVFRRGNDLLVVFGAAKAKAPSLVRRIFEDSTRVERTQVTRRVKGPK